MSCVAGVDSSPIRQPSPACRSGIAARKVQPSRNPCRKPCPTLRPRLQSRANALTAQQHPPSFCGSWGLETPGWRPPPAASQRPGPPGPAPSAGCGGWEQHPPPGQPPPETAPRWSAAGLDTNSQLLSSALGKRTWQQHVVSCKRSAALLNVSMSVRRLPTCLRCAAMSLRCPSSSSMACRQLNSCSSREGPAWGAAAWPWAREESMVADSCMPMHTCSDRQRWRSGTVAE